MQKRIIKIENASITVASSVVGKHEAKGPLGARFDACDTTDKFGADTWEKAESAMQKKAFECLLTKLDDIPTSFSALFAGDLQNQCVGSSYGLMEFDIPYFGLYGRCNLRN